MMIVAVDAEHPDRLAVHEELAVADLDRAEADELGVDLGDGAAGSISSAVTRYRVGDSADHGSTPGNPNDADSGVAAEQVGRREPVRERRRSGHVRRVDRAGSPREADLPSGPVGGDRRAWRSPRACRPPDVPAPPRTTSHDERGEMHRAPRLNVHRAVQAGHPPLVLVLDVAVGAPARDHDGDIVRSTLTNGEMSYSLASRLSVPYPANSPLT